MFPEINESFYAIRVPPAVMDMLWAEGWRRAGPLFYRYSRFDEGSRHLSIIPVRINLSEFKLSKSQRRIVRKNADLKLKIQNVIIDEKREKLFERHKKRFKVNPPDSLNLYLGSEINLICRTVEFSLWDEDILVAASYLDTGINSTSSIYAMFDPDYSRRSPGIFTMLLEIEYSRNNGFKFYYPGYTSVEPSIYDYKKNFSGLEYYDWSVCKWKPYKNTRAEN